MCCVCGSVSVISLSCPMLYMWICICCQSVYDICPVLYVWISICNQSIYHCLSLNSEQDVLREEIVIHNSVRKKLQDRIMHLEDELKKLKEELEVKTKEPAEKEEEEVEDNNCYYKNVILFCCVVSSWLMPGLGTMNGESSFPHPRLPSPDSQLGCRLLCWDFNNSMSNIDLYRKSWQTNACIHFQQQSQRPTTWAGCDVL